jgi:Domain of unknown function (DUF4386)
MTTAAATPERAVATAGPRSEAAGARDGSAGAPVSLHSRALGGLWLLVIVTGTFTFLAASSVIADGDAAATAANIRASETMFRLGVAANLMAGVFYLGVTVLLHALLKPVSRSLSLLAASLGVAGVAAGAAATLVQLIPLVLLSEAPYLGAFTAGELQALALALLESAWQGSSLGMVFFGFQCLLAGALIARSGFLPRALGVLLAAGGTSYVVASLASIVAPALGAQLSPFIVPIALLGEGSLSVWLIAKGVDAQRWRERARSAESHA